MKKHSDPTKKHRQPRTAEAYKVVNVKVAGDQWDGLRVVAVKRNEPVWQVLQAAINRYLAECSRPR